MRLLIHTEPYWAIERVKNKANNVRERPQAYEKVEGGFELRASVTAPCWLDGWCLKRRRIFGIRETEEKIRPS